MLKKINYEGKVYLIIIIYDRRLNYLFIISVYLKLSGKTFTRDLILEPFLVLKSSIQKYFLASVKNIN